MATFLAAESDPTCKRNAFVFLAHASMERAVEYVLSVYDVIPSLDEALQMSIIEVIRADCKSDSVHQARHIQVMFELLNVPSHAVKYEAATTLTTLTQNPAAVKAAASSLINIVIKESDNNIKIIVLDRLDSLRAAAPQPDNGDEDERTPQRYQQDLPPRERAPRRRARGGGVDAGGAGERGGGGVGGRGVGHSDERGEARAEAGHDARRVRALGGHTCSGAEHAVGARAREALARPRAGAAGAGGIARGAGSRGGVEECGFGCADVLTGFLGVQVSSTETDIIFGSIL